MTEPITAQSVLAKVDNLPTLSAVAVQVGELVHNPRTSAREIADVMRGDPSLSAKVLRMVNSPYYGIPGGVSDVARAIPFIGFNTLHQLVLSVSVLDALKTPTGSEFDARGLWLHSLAVGVCAKVIAGEIGHPDPGCCFTAGLLHDMGKIALAKAAPEAFGAALDQARLQGVSLSVCEKELGLPSHARVGSQLARKWKFPATLFLPIELHHSVDDPQTRHKVSDKLIASIDIVALADSLVRKKELGNSGSPAPENIDAAALSYLNLTTLRIDGLYSEMMRQLESSKMFLELID